MPRDLARFAYCTGPGNAKSHKNFSGLLGLLVSSWFANKVLTIAGAVAILGGVLFFTPCPTILIVVAVIVGLLEEAKEWYYHERLLCVGRDEDCVVGTVLHQPEASWDGDRKMDLLLAPFTEKECYNQICTHINTNNGLLNNPASFNNPPFFTGIIEPAITCDPDILDDPLASPEDRQAARQDVSDYLSKIEGKDPNDGDATSNIYNNLLIGFMDRLLDPTNTNSDGNPKNFQGRYYRKDAAILGGGSPLWNAIPHDYDTTVNWQAIDSSISSATEHNPYEKTYQPRGVNPMFRFDKKRLLPYLHCEIDGSYMAVFIDRLIITIISFGIAQTFLCILPIPPWLAPILAALFAWLIYLLQELIDGDDAGIAGEPDVDYDDPDNFGEEGQQLDGDLVSIYGPWIMDTEHAQYFEIHPVKAYYILGRNGLGDGAFEYDSKTDLIDSGVERLQNDQITPELKDEICGLIRRSEEEEIDDVIEKSGSALLSHGMQAYYGGGGIAVD